jgi:DNA-binding transcriptional MocR family regulator
VNAAPTDADYTPRYIRLARLLRGWIEDGTYPPGSLLPSATRLAELHTVSKSTARHALEVLVKADTRATSNPSPIRSSGGEPGTTKSPDDPALAPKHHGRDNG